MWIVYVYVQKLAQVLHAERPHIYKDANHKPEIAIALTPFETMCGFRNISEIKHHLRKQIIKHSHSQPQPYPHALSMLSLSLFYPFIDMSHLPIYTSIYSRDCTRASGSSHSSRS